VGWNCGSRAIAVGVIGLQAGCGTLVRVAQSSARPDAVRTRAVAQVRLEDRPEGATVFLVQDSGTPRAVAGDRINLAYNVLEPPVPPPGPSTLFVGMGLELLAVAAAGYAATRPDTTTRAIGIAGGIGFGLAALVDGIVAISVVSRPSTASPAPAISEPRTVRFVAHRGAQTWTATVTVPWSDRARFGARAPGAQPKPGVVAPVTKQLARWSTVQPAPPIPGTRWYGYQTLALDGVAATGFIYGVYGGQSEVLWSSVALYALGAPIVHAVQGEFAGLGKSLGARVLLTGAGAGLGVLFGLGLNEVLVDGDLDRGEVAQAFAPIGAALGAIAAMGLDASLIAWAEPEALSPSVQSDFQCTPTIAWTKKGRPALGVAGRF